MATPANQEVDCLQLDEILELILEEFDSDITALENTLISFEPIPLHRPGEA